IEVSRIADFTNPSAWINEVEDELIWLLIQAGRLGVVPGGLAHWPVTL
ncbi:hypothetical protein U9M48_031599, partial [Paspalum notatum var. saurae]